MLCFCLYFATISSLQEASLIKSVELRPGYFPSLPILLRFNVKITSTVIHWSHFLKGSKVKTPFLELSSLLPQIVPLCVQFPKQPPWTIHSSILENSICLYCVRILWSFHLLIRGKEDEIKGFVAINLACSTIAVKFMPCSKPNHNLQSEQSTSSGSTGKIDHVRFIVELFPQLPILRWKDINSLSSST